MLRLMFAVLALTLSAAALPARSEESRPEGRARPIEGRRQGRPWCEDGGGEGGYRCRWRRDLRVTRRLGSPAGHGSQLLEARLELVKGVVKDDFLVNDDTTGRCEKEYTAAAMDARGGLVVVWHDRRNGWADIYAQRYDSSGVPLGPNFRVSDNAGLTYESFPAVGMNGSGQFVVAWEDVREGYYDIYAQMYDSLGGPRGANFKVNDDTVWVVGQTWPSVAMAGGGGFVVVWMTMGTGGDIYAQRYDSAGTPQGPNFKVNDDVGTVDHSWPTAAMDGTGGFVVAWQDGRNGDHDIYAQRYDSAGVPQGANFRVNDDAGADAQEWPSATMDGTGEFVVAWEDGRSDFSDIYAQRYDSAGIPQGANFKVNDDAGAASQHSASAGMDGNGGFVVVWADYRDVSRDIYAQRYDSAGNPQGPNFRVNDDAGAASQWGPSVGVSGSGRFAVAWEDKRDGYADIFGQRYDASGAPQGANWRVNDDRGSAHQENHALAMGARGGFVVAWDDFREGWNSDIYAQMYDSSGTARGVNFRVDDATAAWQSMPSAAVGGSGRFAVVWEDSRDFYPDIYGQRYDSAGNPQGPNFRVNDDIGTAVQQYPSAAMDAAGGLLVTWQDAREGDEDIYAQRYDSLGNAQGANFKVNDDGDSAAQWSPSAAMSESGASVLTWEDYRFGYDGDIYAQRYDSSGKPQGPNFRVNDELLPAWQGVPSAAMDRSGAFVVAWVDNRDAYWDIYAQRYDSCGNAQGANFRVNDHAGSVWGWPSVALDPVGGKFVVSWTDSRNPDGDPEVMAQLYVNGVPSGPNVQINQPDSFPYNHQRSWRFSVASNSELVAFAWMDNRRHKGWDIYAKLTDWNLTGVEEKMPEARSQKPEARLMQNWPNPFGAGGTTIQFKVQSAECKVQSAKCKVSLRVYDVSGRLVRTLVDGEQEGGMHSVSWDGKDGAGRPVSTGVYLYRLEGGDFSAVRKLVVLK